MQLELKLRTTQHISILVEYYWGMNTLVLNSTLAIIADQAQAQGLGFVWIHGNGAKGMGIKSLQVLATKYMEYLYIFQQGKEATTYFLRLRWATNTKLYMFGFLSYQSL